jgi:hypothetical protein
VVGDAVGELFGLLIGSHMTLRKNPEFCASSAHFPRTMRIKGRILQAV